METNLSFRSSTPRRGVKPRVSWGHLWLLSCFGLPLPGVLDAARADEAATTSQISGTKLPTNAARVDNDTLLNGFGRLLGTVAQEFEMEPGEGRAEVIVWQGAAYKPGRGNFTRAAFKSSLTAAGYTYKDVDKSDVRANPFEEKYGLSVQDAPEGTFDLSPWDKMGYFHATNAQKHKTVVGMWVDKEHDKQLYLAIAEAGFKAPPKEMVLPEVTGANVVLVKDTNQAMKGIAPPKNPAFPKMARVAGRVRGMVKDPAGKPLAGATIVVQSSAAGGFRTSVTVKTNAQGIYDAQPPAGICQVVNADYAVQYNGRRYLLPLHAVDGERDYAPSAQGHIENFVLRTYGVADAASAASNPQWSSNYYGGHIRMQWFQSDIPEGGTFEITLKPSGALMNNVPGRTLVFRIPNKYTSEVFLNDIPIGRYTMSARLFDNGEVLPVHVKRTFGDEDAVEELQIDFEADSSQLASLNRSGIRRFDVMLKP